MQEDARRQPAARAGPLRPEQRRDGGRDGGSERLRQLRNKPELRTRRRVVEPDAGDERGGGPLL